MRRALTLERATVAIVLLLVFVVAVRPAIDNDLWFHLRTGQWMVQHHSIVHADPFNHTRPGVVRVQTDWIGQLLLYGLWVIGHGPLVAVFVAGLATAGMAAVFAATRGPLVVRVYAVALSAAASSLFWSARTQMFTFALTAATVAALRRWRDRPRLLWWLVPVFALWANLHGGVAYGLAVLWLTAAGELANRVVGRVEPLDRAALRTLVGVAAAATAAIVLNPSGLRIYGLPFHQLTASVTFVQEYQPPSLSDAAALPFFLLLALTAAALVAGWRRLDVVDVLLVVFTGALALRVTRGVSFFAVVAAPVLCRHVVAMAGPRLGAARPSREPAPWVLGAAVAVVAAVVAASAAYELRPSAVDARLAREFPVGATQWLNRNRPPAPLFNTFDWGGYLMFFAPEYKVSIDGRTDVYDEYVDTYADVIHAHDGWEEQLDREGDNVAVIDTDSPLAGAMRAGREWAVAYEDPVATVFVRLPRA